MTIQIPNVGTGVPADQTGDSPWLAMKKVADNFANQTHAASRLVGESAGNLMQVGAFGFGSSYKKSYSNFVNNATTEELSQTRMISLGDVGNMGYPTGIGWSSGKNYYSIIGSSLNVRAPFLATSSDITTAPNSTERNASYKQGQFLVLSYNAAVDGNGFIKAASPVVDLYNDKIELNSDAEKQDITFEKSSVGDYLIKGSLGFAQEGWYIETPKDANGNVLVAVVYEQLANNDISIKTYAKKFDDETGDIVPNLLKPRDIPAGRFISLRLHELPKEPPVMPDVDLDKED